MWKLAIGLTIIILVFPILMTSCDSVPPSEVYAADSTVYSHTIIWANPEESFNLDASQLHRLPSANAIAEWTPPKWDLANQAQKLGILIGVCLFGIICGIGSFLRREGGLNPLGIIVPPSVIGLIVLLVYLCRYGYLAIWVY